MTPANGDGASVSGAKLPLQLTLLSRRDCSLCEVLEADLARWDAGRGRYRLTTVDIDTSAELRRRYGLRIPVLLHGDTELCAGRLREGALRALERALDPDPDSSASAAALDAERR